MPTPTSNSFTGGNPTATPRPQPAPAGNPQSHIATSPTVPAMTSPSNRGPDSNWTAHNTLMTTGATATTGISGAALYLQGKQYSATQKKDYH